jgi:hypothetical protein
MHGVYVSTDPRSQRKSNITNAGLLNNRAPNTATHWYSSNLHAGAESRQRPGVPARTTNANMAVAVTAIVHGTHTEPKPMQVVIMATSCIGLPSWPPTPARPVVLSTVGADQVSHHTNGQFQAMAAHVTALIIFNSDAKPSI